MPLHAVLLAGWLIVAQAAPGNPIVSPIETHTTTTVQVQAPPPDPKAIADASTQSFQAIVVNVVAPTVTGWANDLLDIPDIIRHTPADLTYGNGAVQQMVGTTGGVATALVVLFVFGFGIATALGQRPSAGRLILAALLSLTNIAWWHMGVDLLNGINDAIAAPSTAELVKPHMTLPDIAADPVKAFGPSLLLIAYAVVTLLLFISAAFRLGLIDVLIVIGPLALLCGALEEASGAMAFYSRYLTLSVGTLFSQVLIVVCLKLVPILGVIGSGVAGAILGLAVLLLARRMPALLTSGAGSGSSGAARAGAFLLLRRIVAKV